MPWCPYKWSIVLSTIYKQSTSNQPGLSLCRESDWQTILLRLCSSICGRSRMKLPIKVLLNDRAVWLPAIRKKSQFSFWFLLHFLGNIPDQTYEQRLRSTLKTHLYDKGNSSPGTEGYPLCLPYAGSTADLQKALKAPTLPSVSPLAHGQAQTEHTKATPGSKDVEHLP